MNIIFKESHEAMSHAAAELVRSTIHAKPTGLICFSSGSSPARMYQILATGPVISQHSIRAIALDEWHGIDQRHPATCRHQLEHQVFNPWGIPEARRYLFNAAAPDAEVECLRMAQVLCEQGPIDCCILGLGRNGHLGLNEPAEVLHQHAHVTELEITTQQHPMLLAEGAMVTRGMTFGMADIMAARRIFLLITGTGKTEVTRALLKGEITTHLPASLLHLHPETTMIVDKTVLEPQE